LNVTNYLDRAVKALRSIGLNLAEREPTPVLPLLDMVQQYDATRVMSIAATLQYASTFNAAVREQIGGMDISARYADIAGGFTSIREDAAQMAGWMEDGKLDMGEKLQLAWMNFRRGSIPDRFDTIKSAYLAVAKAADDQIQRESTVLTAYQDFRLALKAAEVDAQDVLLIATQALNQRKAALSAASMEVEKEGLDEPTRVRLELARDEAVRAVQVEDKAYQIVKDLADDLKTSYNSAELVFARLQQTHTVKERLYQRSVTFFNTNEVVFTGLAASFTSMSGLAESTNAMNAMTDGISQGLEALAKTGGKQLEAGMRAGYGRTVRAESVRALADAVVEFQSSSQNLIAQLRQESTLAAQEIATATEQGKQRFAALVNKGATHG
jgi:hypothetical protein